MNMILFILGPKMNTKIPVNHHKLQDLTQHEKAVQPSVFNSFMNFHFISSNTSHITSMQG